jgi:hypothetical protein
MNSSMPPAARETRVQSAGQGTLRFGRGEWAGAFGDLGTLVPFLLAYITIAGVAPSGMLFGFGIALVAAGVFFRTPFPVQPMKAIGAIAVTGAAQTAVVMPEAVAVAALATGIIWLLLGLTGTAERAARWVGRPVTVGIVLGLGIAFMLEGTRMMAAGVWVAAPLLLVTILLLTNRAWLLARHDPGAERRRGVGDVCRAVNGRCARPDRARCDLSRLAVHESHVGGCLHRHRAPRIAAGTPHAGQCGHRAGGIQQP